MKPLLYAIRHYKQIDWKNPFKVSREYAPLYMCVIVIIAIYSVFVTPTLPTFFSDILLGVGILTFVVSMIENTRKGLPFWTMFCGTPLKLPIYARPRLAAIQRWIQENVEHDFWTVDIITKERALISRDRDFSDLSFLTDSVYLIFLRRNDAIMAKLKFG